ncbi:MAG: YceI family protein [Flaviaesturariibacter sp.]|nr:YceI family protein [Flaviaesturariibacter sp.]
MKKIILPVLSLFLLGALLAFAVPTGWAIARNHSIAFTTSGVSGIFKTFSGTIAFDEANPAASRFDVTIDVASINTGNGLQNKHAKSADWFNAATYPSIRFTSKKFVKSGAAYLVTGDLTVHGITREASLPFTFRKTPAGGLFTGTFAINRTDFRIGAPGGEVGEVIKLAVSVPVTKK